MRIIHQLVIESEITSDTTKNSDIVLSDFPSLDMNEETNIGLGPGATMGFELDWHGVPWDSTGIRVVGTSKC